MSPINNRVSTFSSLALALVLGTVAISLCTPVSALPPNGAASNFTEYQKLLASWELDVLANRPQSVTAPWKASEDWIVSALSEGTVLSTKPIGHGVTNPFKAEIEFEERRIHAVWKPLRETDFEVHESYEAEVVAYRLSQHLGLDMVPPTVKRKIGRRWGSLQFWVEDYTMMTKVLPQRPYDFMRSDQVELMRFFDALIDNPDRNAGNYLVNDSWQVVLIDHSRAMDYDNMGAQRDAPMPMRFQHDVVNRLGQLNMNSLTELLGDLLPRQDLRGLNLSAKRLLRFANEEAKTHGASVFFTAPRPVLESPTTLTQKLDPRP